MAAVNHTVPMVAVPRLRAAITLCGARDACTEHITSCRAFLLLLPRRSLCQGWLHRTPLCSYLP